MSVLKHTWNFRNVSTPHHKAAMPFYKRALGAALSEMQNAQPFHSGFKVGCAVLDTFTGRLALGSNSEYGAGYGRATSRALHAEMSAVDKIRRYLNDGDKVIVAVIGDAPGPVTPCGDCRDYLHTFFPMDTEILAANVRGDVDILTLSALLPDSFRTARQNLFSDSEQLLMRAVSYSFNRGLVLEPGLREGAAILTAKEKVYLGARVDTASYHPTSALASAISTAVAAGDFDITAIAVIPNTPILSGLERQRIFDIFDVLHRLDTGTIFMADPALRVSLQTTSRLLLPYGFGMATIGKDGEIQALIENLRAMIK